MRINVYNKRMGVETLGDAKRRKSAQKACLGFYFYFGCSGERLGGRKSKRRLYRYKFYQVYFKRFADLYDVCGALYDWIYLF